MANGVRNSGVGTPNRFKYASRATRRREHRVRDAEDQRQQGALDRHLPVSPVGRLYDLGVEREHERHPPQLRARRSRSTTRPTGSRSTRSRRRSGRAGSSTKLQVFTRPSAPRRRGRGERFGTSAQRYPSSGGHPMRMWTRSLGRASPRLPRANSRPPRRRAADPRRTARKCGEAYCTGCVATIRSLIGRSATRAPLPPCHRNSPQPARFRSGL